MKKKSRPKLISVSFTPCIWEYYQLNETCTLLAQGHISVFTFSTEELRALNAHLPARLFHNVPRK